jgi:hypothetical protein
MVLVLIVIGLYLLAIADTREAFKSVDVLRSGEG